MIYKCLTYGFGAAFVASLILLWMRGILLRESENELARTRSALDWWRNRFEEQRTSERVPTRYECYWRDIAFKWRDRALSAQREREKKLKDGSGGVNSKVITMTAYHYATEDGNVYPVNVVVALRILEELDKRVNQATGCFNFENLYRESVEQMREELKS